MDADEFVKIMNQLGYEVDGALELRTMGAEKGYEFSLRPIEQGKFNWKRCDNRFLEQMKKAANIPLTRMDFTTIKELFSDKPFIRIITTGLLKVVVAMSLVNSKLPYHM